MSVSVRPSWLRAAKGPAQILLEAMAAPPDTSRQSLITTTVSDLISAGVWGKLDLLYVLAAHDAQAARLNWKAPGLNSLIAINSPTFAVDRGYTGDGATSYLETGAEIASLRYYKADSATLAAFPSTSSTSTAFDVGSSSSAVVGLRASANSSARFNINDIAVTTATLTTSVGLVAARRDGPTKKATQGGASIGSVTAAVSSAPSGATFAIGRGQSSFSARRQSLFCAGGLLTDVEVASFNTIINAYMTAVGVPVV